MQSLPKLDRFIIELCPPLNPDDIPAYFKKFQHLLKLTNKFSIASHPIGQVSGFERGYNLAKYLLEHHPNVVILFHITCNDLNRVNIQSRLTLLKNLQVKHVLVITGENYKKELHEANFTDSSELLAHIAENFNWFESIGIAAYPGDHENLESANKQEAIRLRNKTSHGANKIYTQCIFSADKLTRLMDEMRNLPGPKLGLIPSVALFSNTSNLSKVSRLTRVQPDVGLTNSLANFKSDEEQRVFARDYIIDLCRESLIAQPGVCIIICTFGLFDLAGEILEELMSSKD